MMYEMFVLVRALKHRTLRRPYRISRPVPTEPKPDYRRLAAQLRRLIQQGTVPGDARLIAFERAIERLNSNQRAMIGARVADSHRGHNKRERHDNVREDRHGQDPQTSYNKATLTNADVATRLHITPRLIQYARTVLRRGDSSDIARVEAGQASVMYIVEQIYRGTPTDTRAILASLPPNQRGKNPERIQRLRLNAGLWRLLRDGLSALTSLPRPSDVVAIARANDKGGLVDDKLSRACEWLTEFSDEWTRPNRND